MEGYFEGKHVSNLQAALDRAKRALADAMDERKARREKLNRLDRNGRTQEYIDQAIADINEAGEADRLEIASRYDKAVADVMAELEKKHAGFDPDSPSLQNALRVIEATGGKLPGELAGDLLKGLKNQPEYKVVRAALEKAGADGFALAQVDARMYDWQGKWKWLESNGFDMIRKDVLLGSLTQGIEQLAKLEGLEFDRNAITPNAMLDGVRQGAGLPPESGADQSA
jgi:hypothetical protein